MSIPNRKKGSSCDGLVSYERGEQRLGKFGREKVAGLLDLNLTMIVFEWKGNKMALGIISSKGQKGEEPTVETEKEAQSDHALENEN